MDPPEQLLRTRDGVVEGSAGDTPNVDLVADMVVEAMHGVNGADHGRVRRKHVMPLCCRRGALSEVRSHEAPHAI